MALIRLDVLEGSHRRTLTLDADPVRIGRDHDCEVYLPGDPTVSRVHALLVLTATGWQLVDNGSRNGTLVNGERLTDAHPVRPHDRIMVGGFVLVPQDAEDVAVETAAAGERGASRAQVESGLSLREVEVLRLVVAGQSDKQIADTLVLSVSTVQSHLDRIRDKTGQRRRPELVRWAIDHGLA